MADVVLVKGSCPLDCQDTCSWVAHVDNGKVVKVAGARDHPFTRGVLCAKVKDYEQRTYASDRLLHPLRRVGEKGSHNFERITWDEAVGTIAARFGAIIDEFGAEALMPLFFLGSLGAVQHDALRRLFHVLGASRPTGSVCAQAGNVLAAEGHPRGFDPEDIVEAELIVVWGANLLTTAHHHWHFITEARKNNGARIVVIDPIRTRTAQAADDHVPIRPGTDRVLALGLANVLLREGLADIDYARDWADDVDVYLDEVVTWTPERVAAECGITEETVVSLGRQFGTARPAVIRSGVGPQQSVGGEAYLRSLSALAILGGHWKLRGGGMFAEAYPEFDIGAAAGIDLVDGDPRHLDIARMGPLLSDPDLDPPIKGLMVWNMNPAIALPDSATVAQGLGRVDLFTVVVEHFMTDTARYADIVLPSTTQLEHFDILGAWGHHYISVNNPAITPLGETKSHGEVMRLLATAMNLEHPALKASDEQIAAAALPENVDLDQLKADGWHKISPPAVAAPGSEAKLHLTGPTHEAQPPPEPDMLQMLTPKGQFFMNTSFANMSRHRKAMKHPILEMNPTDAAARSLTDGQQVAISNDQGVIVSALQISDAVRPGVTSLPGKWWAFPTETAAVANILSPSAWSPGGQPAYNDIYVHVTPAETSQTPSRGDGPASPLHP
ncbi:MAG: molybdopterin-dependent oxidoreductase [Acidobacteria bacterium]|nr:molybdopterin-dependent oxidoreductase [Acidobacteriota bacterium]